MQWMMQVFDRPRRARALDALQLLRGCGDRLELFPPASNIGPGSYVRWESLGWRADLNGAGEVFWWSWTHGRSVRSRRRLEPLSALTRRSEQTGWRCDIRDVVGVTASRARLEDFQSLDQLALSRPDVSGEVSEAKLRANLDYYEVRITKPHSRDLFVRRLWDNGRVFLANSGGSRHFAGARYIATRLGLAVPLQGRLVTYALVPESVSALRAAHRIFAIPAASLGHFGDAMERLRAPYGELPLPAPYEHALGILLPLDDPRARAVAEALAADGRPDVGALLSTAAQAQASA